MYRRPAYYEDPIRLSFPPLGTGDADGSNEPPVGKDAGSLPLRHVTIVRGPDKI